MSWTARFTQNDIRHVVEADKAHVWHHLIQHKQFETNDPRIIVEGKGMRVWDQNGKEYLDAVSGGVWTVNVGYGRESIAKAVYDQLMKLCYFAQSAGSIPGSHIRRETDREDAGHVPRLLHQLGLRGEREGVQDDPPDRPQAIRRQEAQDPLPRPRLSRRHPGHHVGRRPGRAGDAVRPLRARASCGCRIAWNTARRPSGIRPRAATANGPPNQIEAGDPARRPRHRRRALPRAGHRRRRRHHPARGLLGAGAGDLPQIRHPAAHRRGGLRHRAAPAPGSATSITASSPIS